MTDITRKEFDNTLLFLALSHIDSAFRSMFLGSVIALQRDLTSSPNEIISFLKKEVESAKKLAYMIVSLGYKEDDEFVKKQREFIDDYIDKRHADKLRMFERASNNTVLFETLVNAGIEDMIFGYIFK